MLRNMANRWLEVRPSFLPLFPCRIYSCSFLASISSLEGKFSSFMPSAKPISVRISLISLIV